VLRLDRAARRPGGQRTSSETKQQCEVAAPLHPRQRTGHVQNVVKLLHKRTINKHEKLGSNSTVYWRCHTS
jgi:hypothetical protein